MVSLLDALTRHRTDGALVRVVAPLGATTSEADTDRRMAEFIARFAADLPRYIPN